VVGRSSNRKTSNYRPVSIIPNFANVFEHLLFNFLPFNVHPIINCCQHGFVGGRSTVTNLCTITTITEFLSGTLDERRQVIVYCISRVVKSVKSNFQHVVYTIFFRRPQKKNANIRHPFKLQILFDRAADKTYIGGHGYYNCVQ
jgi:hypothetical protein